MGAKRSERAARLAARVAWVPVLALLAACGVDDSVVGNSELGPAPGPERVVVGSGTSTTSELLAEIYANSLRATGVAVDTRPGLGDRAGYLTELDAAAITLVPEFTGRLLHYYDHDATETVPDDVFEALNKSLPEGLSVSDYAMAEDRSVLVVTAQTADRWHLETVDDLAPHCGELTVATTPEFAANGDLPAPGSGCTFAGVRDLGDDASAVHELTGGGVQAAGLTTASADLASARRGALVPLDDDAVFTAQNVVPLFRKGTLGQAQIEALNIVAGELTTADLAGMLGQLRDGDTSPAEVAQAWLAERR